MSNLSTLPKGDSAWLLRKAIERIMQQISVLETNIGSSTTGNSANTQVIFNDNGTLRGDPDLTFNTSLNKLVANNIETAAGLAVGTSATITGNLTVQGNGPHRFGTLNYSQFDQSSLQFVGTRATPGTLSIYGNTNRLVFQADTGGYLFQNAVNTTLLSIANDATQVTLNSTGLGVGMSPANNLSIGSTTYASFGVKIDSIAQSSLIFKGTPDAAGYEHAKIVSGREPSPFTYGSFLAFYTEGKNSGTTDTSTERVRIDSSGNVGFGVTPSAGGGCLQLKSGITFPATQVASSDANTLDDYEEGTWTPVVADASTGGNVGTCTINTATYTKIGRQVSIQCDLRSITTTGMTGGNKLFIRGLPFASVKGGNGNFYTYRVGRNASTVSSEVSVEQGVSYAFLSLFTASSANTNLSILVSDIVSGTSELALSVTYTV